MAMQHVAGNGFSYMAYPAGGGSAGSMGTFAGAPPDALSAASGVGASSPTAAAVALVDLAGRLKAAGDGRGAAEKYYDALRLDPANVSAHVNLGALFLAAGDVQRAVEHSERAYQLDPRNGEAMCNLGAVCRVGNNFETACQWYRAAVRVGGTNLETASSALATCLINLGLQRKALDPKGAIKCYQEALVHSPTNANAYYNLGVSYAEMQKHNKALINYNLTVHFDPRCAEAYNNMGVIFKEQENLEKALKYYHLALQCNPRFSQTLNNLGVAYTTIGRLTEALEYLSRAVAVAPNYAEAYNNLGWLFWDHGDLAQALRMYERCIELSPSSKNPSQNRLLALNYLHDVSHERVFEAHRTWAERFCIELGPAFTDWPVQRTTNRRLRIGYISPDFFHHSVSFFCHALFEHHNRDLFEIFLYSNASREDDKTELFKGMVPPTHWKKVLGRPAHEVAALIREDQIDILVELAGHTANNRLDVAALKPAPVQFTYIGYNNTTGMGAIDYRITDAVVDPPESEQHFSEELVRMPGCFLCYTPPARIPDVDQLPALKNGFVTFGSFSCLAKVGEPCVALWARVLREVPNSRLLVKNKGFYSPDVQATFINKFKAHGISEHRLKLMALAPTSFDHLKIYNEVDIALDTFPYSNTTTSCETLLMGVPVICLAGNTHGSRVGVTLLTAIGLNEFIAENLEEYVMKARNVASNLSDLATLRHNLRQVLLASQLCDGPGFVRNKYEPALLEKWRHFCEGRPPSMQVFTSSETPGPLGGGPFAPPLPPGAPLVQSASQGTSPSHIAQHSSVSMAGGATVQVVTPATGNTSLQACIGINPTGLVTASHVAGGSGVTPVLACGAAPGAVAQVPLNPADAGDVQMVVAAAQGVQLGQQPQPMLLTQEATCHPASAALVPQGVTGAALGAGAGMGQLQMVSPTAAVHAATKLPAGAAGHGGGNGIGAGGGFPPMTLTAGVPGVCVASSNGMLPGVQPGRRRPRARPQGRRA